MLWTLVIKSVSAPMRCASVLPQMITIRPCKHAASPEERLHFLEMPAGNGEQLLQPEKNVFGREVSLHRTDVRNDVRIVFS